MKQNMTKRFGNRQWVMFLLVLFTCMTLCVDAMAKPKTTRVLNQEAAAAFEKGDYDTALAKFNESYAQNPKPSLLYNMGRACQGKADHQGAIHYYTLFVASPDVDQENLEDALNRIESLKKVIELTGGQPMVAPVAAPASVAAPAAPKTAKKSSKNSGKPAVNGCVDINTADEKGLQALTGVGPAMAKKIIAAREASAFQKVEDLQKIKGIGPAKFDKMKDDVCPIGGGVAPAPVVAPVAAPVPAAPKAPKAPGIPAPPKAAGGTIDI